MTEENPTLTFDIREVLADRDQPTGEVTVYMDEVLMRDIVKINKELARLSTLSAVSNADAAGEAADAYTALENTFEAAKKDLRDKAYVIHLRGINPTRKNDIKSKAMHEVPLSRDLYGRDDPQNEFKREAVLRRLIFAAYIEKIVAPNGAVQVLTLENAEGVAASLVDTAPDEATLEIDRAIGELTGAIDLKLFEEQGTDFLSKP